MDAATQKPSVLKPRKGGPGKKDKVYKKLTGRNCDYLFWRRGSPYIWVRKKTKGKPIFKSTGTDNENLAKIRRDEIIAQSMGAPARRSTRITVREVYEEFKAQKEPTIQEDSFNNHYVYPWKELEADFADLFIDEIRVTDWKNFVAKKRRADSDRLMFSYHTLLNSIIKYALEAKYLKEDPGIKLDRKKEKEPEVDPWTKVEAETCYLNSEGTLHKVIRVMGTRGPRPKEARLLRKSFFDFEHETIELPGFIKEGKKSVRYTKTGKPRSIPMGKMKDEFKRWISEAPGDFIMFDSLAPHKPIGDDQLEDQWNGMRDALGLKGGLYRFRHYAAVTMLKAGINPITVAKIMGHDIKTLFRKYSRFLKADLNEAVERLED